MTLTSSVKSVLLSVLVFVLVGAGQVHPQSPKGHLVIIGGGDRTEEIMKRFIELAGPKERAKIVVIPMASAVPQKRAVEYIAEFKSYGFSNVAAMVLTREQAMTDSAVRALDGTTGVFFSGGDQARLAAVIVGTPVQKKLQQLYEGGSVMCGTSAGAAIMSKVMITGNELLHRDTTNEEDPRSSFTFIKKKNIETIEGLGFLTDEIIDQHFVARKRHNRLLSMALEHPQLLGIGIDESTAIVVNPDRTFDIMGERTVVVYDASTVVSIKTDKNGNLSGHGLRVHILSAGEKFDLKTKEPIPSPVTR